MFPFWIDAEEKKHNIISAKGHRSLTILMTPKLILFIFRYP
jgi:hypothetical protein